MKNLKKERLAAGMSQSDLAKKAGVPVRNIRAYEAEAASASTCINNAEALQVYKLALALGCAVGDILELSEV